MKNDLVFVIVFVIVMLAAFLPLIIIGGKAECEIYERLERRNDRLRGEINQTFSRLCSQQGYRIDEGHEYEIVETDSGYDLVLHFVKEAKP